MYIKWYKVNLYLRYKLCQRHWDVVNLTDDVNNLLFLFNVGTKSKMTTGEQHEENKKNVSAFYDLMFNQNNPKDAINRYVGDIYIQHNTAVGGG